MSTYVFSNHIIVCTNYKKKVDTQKNPVETLRGRASLDACSAHGGSTAHALADHCEGDSPVCGHTLLINEEVRLDLLKHFLLRIKLGIWGAYKQGGREGGHSKASSNTVNPERIASVIFNDFINPATLTSLYDNDFHMFYIRMRIT